MKRFFVLTLLPIIALAAGPAPYPVSVNSQSPVVTSLQSYQANERTFRVTFKDGTNAVNLTGYTPRMTWATTNTATNVATSSWSYVVSSTSGVVDFTFTPASMNTNGVFIYEVGVAGLPFVYRQGVFAIISSPQGNGAAALTFTNPASYVATVGSQVSGIGFDHATGAAVLTGIVAAISGVITGNQHNAILGGLTISNALTVDGAITANDNIDIAATKHLRFIDGNGTNRITLDGVDGRLIVSGAVDIVTTKTNPLTINGVAVSTGGGGGSGTLTGVVVGAGSSTRLTSTNSGSANATINFDATGLATGTPLYVQSETNANARLDSNVWAAADSTTNFFKRTGDVLTGNIGVVGNFNLTNTVGGCFIEVGDDGNMTLGATAIYLGGTAEANTFSGNGSLLTNIPFSGLSFKPITNVAATRYEASATNFLNITNSAGLLYPVGCFSNGSAGSGGGTVTLNTNPVLKVSAHPGSWAVSSDVPTNGGGALAFEQPYTTSTVYRASFRTISTSAVSRVIQGGPVILSSIETNWLWFDIDHIGTNAATIQFTADGSTNVLFSQNLTTTGVYRISGTNAANNRELIPYLYTTNTGPGSTNFSRTWIPIIRAVVQ